MSEEPGGLPAKRDIIRAIQDQRRRTLSFLSEFDPPQYDLEVLPGWRVREVLAHLIASDKATVTGRILPAVFRSMDYLEKWNERQVPRWANRDPGDLLVGLDRWGRRFVRFVSTIPSPMYRLPMPTMLGRGPGGLLVFARAYDEWIHRQDIRRAMGQSDEDVDLAPIVEFLFTAMRTHTLPQLRDQKGRIGVTLEGVPLPEWQFDAADGSAGPASNGGADARVTASAPAFIMTAAGRGTFDELEQCGGLSIEGDAELARSMLRVLRIV